MAKFGAYEILHELKSGGMGAVLLGRRRGPGSFEQLVAIKTIRSEYANAEAVRAMFLDEAKVVGGITHPGIAVIHDFGEEAGTLYMAMEYVAGLSFRSAMELGMPPSIAARAIAEACRGLHAAHEVRDPAGHLQGVVHRDISPDNLLLGFDGHVKVIDFGIALVKNRQSPVTEFGTVKGKPPYMSPEQVKNEGLDRRSDVFSLGVVLHELLTGQLLFDADSIYAIARQVEHMDIPLPSQVIGKPLPPGLDAVVMAALDRDPAKRPQTAAAFAEQLEQVIASAADETLESWAERTLADERDRHRAWLAEVVAGRDAPRPIGRATGSVTALGPLALDHLPMAATPLAVEVAPRVELTDPAIAPPRRLGLAIAILLILALGAVVVVLLTRTPKVTVPDAAVAIADASPPDTAVVVIAPPPDAELIEPDAALPPDARVVARDAGTPKRDAAVVALPPDAAPEVPVGNGKLIVRHHSSRKTFLRVLLDGKPLGDTPILPAREVAAGPHSLTLIEPLENGVVYQTKITITEGVTTTIVQPAP